MLILQGVGGLGQKLGMVILWGRERGGWGQILGILYFGRGGSVRGVCGQTLGMLITGRAGGGFGDRYRAVYSIGGGRVLGQRLGMLIL